MSLKIFFNTHDRSFKSEISKIKHARERYFRSQFSTCQGIGDLASSVGVKRDEISCKLKPQQDLFSVVIRLS